MAWLNGWKKRIKLTIDKDDIDAALSDFPILVYVSASSGHSSKDISCVFDELTSNDNRKKIAVTTSDGHTQCYVEIEQWDDANEKAWLWVKIPNISKDDDTILYLYYDSTHTNNDTYVGDTNSTPAENVWDANFKFVSHMRDDPDDSHIRDSTSNNNDGTKKDAGEPAVTIAGKIGEAQEFDEDFVDCGSGASLNADGPLTYEAYAYLKAKVSDRNIVTKGGEELDDPSVGTRYDVGEDYWVFQIHDGAWQYAKYTQAHPSLDTYYHIAGVCTGNEGDIKIFVNAILGTVTDTIGTLSDTSTQALIIGRLGYQVVDPRWWNGTIDELRISDVDRSVEWLKASYETERDHLLDFGSEEQVIGPFPTHFRIV